MNIWVLVGILVSIGLIATGVISLPTTGFFVDIPSKAHGVLSGIGDPFTILFWISSFLISLSLIRWMIKDG